MKKERSFVFLRHAGVFQKLFPGGLGLIFDAVRDSQGAFVKAALDLSEPLPAVAVEPPDIHDLGRNAVVRPMGEATEMFVERMGVFRTAVHLEGGRHPVGDLVFFEDPVGPLGSPAVVRQEIDEARRRDQAFGVEDRLRPMRFGVEDEGPRFGHADRDGRPTTFEKGPGVSENQRIALLAVPEAAEGSSGGGGCQQTAGGEFEHLAAGPVFPHEGHPR